MSRRARRSPRPFFTAVARQQWTPSFFGVAPGGSVRRRPGDLVRLLLDRCRLAHAVCGWRSRRRCSCRPPYLVHPARLTVHLIQLLALFGGAIAGIGPLGALGVGWAIAAVTSLVIGTPAAPPTTRSVLAALDELGVSVGELALGNNQTWGETPFLGHTSAGITITRSASSNTAPTCT